MNTGNTRIQEKTLPRSRETTRVSPRLTVREEVVIPGTTISGFSMVELMIVMVVIGILAAIAIPNYALMTSRAKESSVKESAHTVQLAAELYALENRGTYSDADEGSIVANIIPLLPGQQRLKNVFTGGRTEPVVGPAANPGEVGYEARVNVGVNVGCTITGFGGTGTVISLTGGS
ncbi:MAG: type II secretion system protein [Candidatus Eisenbacteria bacterium]|nr:type II secretion system protein [Candidatus Eisenbacteria bacterium]